MDMNNAPEPRMPWIEDLQFLDPMGAISSPCTTPSARTIENAMVPITEEIRQK
jgi:hypothetical protein